MPKTKRLTKRIAKPKTKSKVIYRVKNWHEYDSSLVRRGSLTVWIEDKALQQWSYQGPRQQGAHFEYSELAIQSVLTIREVFHLPNRAAEGAVGAK